MSAAAIRLALLLTCGYALCPPGVRMENFIQNIAFSPKRMVWGLLGSPLSTQSPSTSSAWCSTR